MREKLILRLHPFEAALVDTTIFQVVPFDADTTQHEPTPVDNRATIELDPTKLY